LGLPVPQGEIPLRFHAASAVVLADTDLKEPQVVDVAAALAAAPEAELRLFGKPDARPGRRMGVALATGDDVQSARERACLVAERARVV